MVQILKKSQIVFLSIVTLFRIFLSQWIGNWYPSSQTFDDYILVTYANITEHFRTPNINSLIKDMVGNSIASGIIKLYSILNPMLCLIAIVGFFLTLISLLARKNQASKETKRLFVFALSTVFVFAGMSLVYAFGISWFSEFIWRETNIINTNVLKLYTIGIVPMLCMVELFGLYLFSNCIKKALPFFSSRLKKG